jgi:hypothetical protein
MWLLSIASKYGLFDYSDICTSRQRCRIHFWCGGTNRAVSVTPIDMVIMRLIVSINTVLLSSTSVHLDGTIISITPITQTAVEIIVHS